MKTGVSFQLQDEIQKRLALVMEKNVDLQSDQRRRCAQTPDDVQSLGHLHEQISAEAAFLAQRGEGPGTLVQALLNLGLDALAPMAAEAHFHCTFETSRERLRTWLAGAIPVFTVKNDLYVLPIGGLDMESLQAIADRVLQVVLRQKIKRVFLGVDGLEVAADVCQKWISGLKADLQTQKISIHVLPQI